MARLTLARARLALKALHEVLERRTREFSIGKRLLELVVGLLVVEPNFGTFEDHDVVVQLGRISRTRQRCLVLEIINVIRVWAVAHVIDAKRRNRSWVVFGLWNEFDAEAKREGVRIDHKLAALRLVIGLAFLHRRPRELARLARRARRVDGHDELVFLHALGINPVTRGINLQFTHRASRHPSGPTPRFRANTWVSWDAPRGARPTAMVFAKSEGVARNAAGQVEGYEIFIKYLPNSTTEDSLAAFFAEAGPAVGTRSRRQHAPPPPPHASDVRLARRCASADEDGGRHVQGCRMDHIRHSGRDGGGRLVERLPHGRAVPPDLRREGGTHRIPTFVPGGGNAHAGAARGGARAAHQTGAERHGDRRHLRPRRPHARDARTDDQGRHVSRLRHGRSGGARAITRRSRGDLAAILRRSHGDLTAVSRSHAGIQVDAATALRSSDSRFTFHAGCFSTMATAVRAAAGKGAKATAVLFDLGISSPQAPPYIGDSSA